jgi:hypothetical protein
MFSPRIIGRMSNFDRCATLGKKYEQLSTRIFQNNRFEIAEGYFPDWDVKLINNDDDNPEVEVEVTLECKSDTFAARTNQLAIEFEYDGRPSGIQTTKADFWVHYIVGTNNYYLIPVDYLRQMIQDGKWNNRVRGGDGRRSFLYIIDAELFSRFKDSYDLIV